ncbi:MAG: AAA-like domain-containing protein [Desulfamplus sp.]|nr:AAA-like domain-containing protein [Desulfamplus sp.]
MKIFNTAGPVNPEYHYTLEPLSRISLEDIELLIEQNKYFILHAPRQTGKTSCLLDLMEHINNGDQYRALYVNIEPAQSAREDVKRGIKSVLSSIASQSVYFLNDSFVHDNFNKIIEQNGEDNALNEILTQWSAQSTKPIILLIDEIDALIGDTLISVLRQIRAGYTKRPKLFPQTIILCGVRDIRDYRIHSSKDKEIITGGSAFNIKAESLRLGSFIQSEVYTLLEQHTKETGQKFDIKAKKLIWEYTQGQPWLVNALGYETCFRTKELRDKILKKEPITEAMVIQAKEALIIRRETHIDQLADKLREERVKRVIEPILSGTVLSTSFRHDDIEYVRDIGLIEQDMNGEIRLANRIYQEVIPRELAWNIQSGMTVQRVWYIKEDGTIDIDKLLRAFQEFFREHSEHWIERFQYKEAGPQLLLQAFLQRIVNGGGRVEREYGLGRMRTDLLIIWKHSSGVQKVVIELKLLYKSLEKTIAEGLTQTLAYMDRWGTDDGNLLIFDRTKDKSWEEKIFYKEEQIGVKTVRIYGM